jgi:hypothetical protein
MPDLRQLTPKEWQRLREILRHEVTLDLDVLEDLGYCWKEACENLKLLRADRRLQWKLEVY